MNAIKMLFSHILTIKKKLKIKIKWINIINLITCKLLNHLPITKEASKHLYLHNSLSHRIRNFPKQNTLHNDNKIRDFKTRNERKNSKQQRETNDEKQSTICTCTYLTKTKQPVIYLTIIITIKKKKNYIKMKNERKIWT